MAIELGSQRSMQILADDRKHALLEDITDHLYEGLSLSSDVIFTDTLSRDEIAEMLYDLIEQCFRGDGFWKHFVKYIMKDSDVEGFVVDHLKDSGFKVEYPVSD